jgi:Predicted metal-sulfur cluster biosynthetic enzyme
MSTAHRDSAVPQGDASMSELEDRKHTSEGDEPRRLPTVPTLPTMPQSTADMPEAVAGNGERGGEALSEDDLRAAIIEALKTVYDPEIPLNIYDLGLIYGFDLSPEGEVDIRMTLTAPGCPVAGYLVGEVANKVAEVPQVARARVKLVWDPPWSQDRMSEEAQLELGLL